MKIVAIKTDNPTAELYLYEDCHQLDIISWQAHRQLADTIHYKIKTILSDNNCNLEDINGLVVFAGPGSFTGLRIGASVFNALAYALDIPIVGTSGDDWLNIGVLMIIEHKNDKIVIPQYGGHINITAPKR